jgi:tRNA A37 threonylcarbamoyladenosine synthetase subunit TsaC/SUA5/YrdC
VFAGQIPMLLDGGRCPGGVPSTVVDVTVSPVLIRRQGAQLAEVESFLKELV